VIASNYISCFFGRGFDTLHLHYILKSRRGLDLTGSKDIMKIKRVIGTQINTVKAFTALAAIRLLATKENVATEESVLAMAA